MGRKGRPRNTALRHAADLAVAALAREARVVTGEQRLWFAVLADAVQALAADPASVTGPTRRRRALGWIEGDSGFCLEACMLEADHVLEVLAAAGLLAAGSARRRTLVLLEAA